MHIVQESELTAMTVEQRFRLRRECANRRDIESLLAIARYRFLKGSMATNESNFPEICYYYGRLHRTIELERFLQENGFIISMLPYWSIELAKRLLDIGDRFPHLNEDDLNFIEEKYCDVSTFELFDIIMFDSQNLSRSIKKYDKNLLSKTNTDFPPELLEAIWRAFLINEELGDGDQLHVYYRPENRIINKTYENIGLGEYCITQPILSSEFSNLIKNMYGELETEYFAKQLCFDDDWQDFIESDFYLLDGEDIERVASERFDDPAMVEDLKNAVALFWLNKINAEKITLI